MQKLVLLSLGVMLKTSRYMGTAIYCDGSGGWNQLLMCIELSNIHVIFQPCCQLQKLE